MTNTSNSAETPGVNMGPIFSQERWLQRFLRTILRAAVVLGALLVIATFITPNQAILRAIYVLAYVTVLVATFAPIPYRVRAGLFLLVIYGLGVSGIFERGVYGDARIYFPIFIIVMTMLFGRRSTLPAVLIVFMTGVAFGIPIITGKLMLIESASPIGEVDAWIVAYLNMVVAGVLVTTGLRLLFDEFEQAEQSAGKAFEELAKERAELNIRVQERTAELSATTVTIEQRARQLQTISELAHQISIVQNRDELLSAITHLISDRFGFYHVGIFLLDEKGEYAVLQAANSPGGQRMLKRGHRLQVGQTGIVGYVTAANKPRIALDVGKDASFFDNPDLPDTHSEMALPLSISNRVIGALDIQSIQEAAFKEEDFDVMHTLADQVAIAIENSRLIEETRSALKESQMVYRQYLQQEWSQLSTRTGGKGYRRTPEGTTPLSETVMRREIQKAMETGEVVSVRDNTPTLAIPVKLRGDVIGILNIRAVNAGREWTAEDITLLQAISDRIALALDNARLLQDAQRRASKERTIGDITTRFSASVNVRNIVETAISELGRAIPGSEITVQFQNKEQKSE